MSGGWKAVQLKDVADIRVSNVDKKSSPSEFPVHLCNYMDVYANDYVVAGMPFMAATATRREIARFSLHRGDVMITKDSETPDDIGIPSVLVEDIDNLVCGYHLALIRPRAEEVCSVYLAKQLAADPAARYFGLNASGSTRFGIPVAAIENFELLLPALPEQSKIAEVLSTVDRAIAQTEAVIAKQQRIKTGLMQGLLTRGIDEHGQLRSEATHAFKDSSLGRIPVEWDVKEIDELVSRVGSGVTPTGGEAVYTAEGVLFIRSQNVHFDGLRLDDVAYIPMHIHHSMMRSEVFENDVLLNITGASIGRCCQMPKIANHANVNQHVCAIRLRDADKAHAGFLTAVLQSHIGQHQIALMNAGGNREGLNYQQVRSFHVPWPSDPSEFSRICGRIEVFGGALRNHSQDLVKLHSLQTALMQDLLTGKVRVTPLLQQAEEAGTA